jgi:fatty acid desaturase
MQGVPRELLGTARLPRVILLALADWAGIAAIWLAAPRAPFWLYPLWVVLLAGRFHALGVLLHDAAHLPRTPKTPPLRMLEIIAGYPVGTSVDAMRYHHLRHHRDLGLRGDPYLKPWVGKSRARFWVMSLRYFLLVPLWVLRGFYGCVAAYVPGARNGYGRLFLQDGSGEDLTQSAEVIACAREDRWQTIFYVGFALLAALRPRWTLEFYVVPLVVAGYLAGYRLLVEHAQEASEDRSVEAILRSTRNHHLGFAGRLLFAPHNVGYHVVHHLHPQAALENLPNLQKWYELNGNLSAPDAR